MNNLSNVVSERFWSKVDVKERIKCWPWRGAMDDLGYGKFRHEGRTQRAHRIAYWLRCGVMPDQACHSCDHPSCCNPDHIFNGTRSDNMKDMVKKGRHKTDRGEAHGRSVLTNEKVFAIREAYSGGDISMAALAKEYGVSFTTINRVVNRLNWRHL